MPHDFDADGFSIDLISEDADPAQEGPSFTLGGEVFHCLPVMPAGAYVRLPDTIFPADAERFIRRCLIPEDEDRWQAVLLNKRRPVVWNKLSLIANWLLSASGGGYTPFEPLKPAPSPNGQDATATTSTASSDEKESAPET